MSDLAVKTKSSLFWQSIIQPISEFIRFILSIFIARILDPKDFGIMGMASIIILYSNTLSELGFTNALIHKTDTEDKHIHTAFSMNLGVSLFLTGITYIFSPYIAHLFKVPELEDVLKVLSLVFIITSFSQISKTLLRKELEYKKFTLTMFAKGMIQVISTLILALYGFKYWALIYGSVLAELIYTVSLFFVHPYRPRIKFDLSAFKSLYSYGLWNFLSSQFMTIYNYSEKAIIGGFLGPVILGLYEKAWGLALMPISTISAKINGVMFSSFNQYKTNPKELSEAFYKISVVTSFFCFPIFGGLIVVSHNLVFFAFGEKWLPMVPVLKILLVAFVFRASSGLLSSLNMSLNYYKLIIKSQIFVYIITIAAYVFLVDFGIEAIGYAIVVNQIVIFLLNLWVAKVSLPDLSIRRYCYALFPGALYTGIMVLSVSLINMAAAIGSPLEELLVQIGLGAIVYIVLVYSLRFRNTKAIRDGARQVFFKIFKISSKPA